MGLSCKPVGKLGSIFQKLQNELDAEKKRKKKQEEKDNKKR